MAARAADSKGARDVVILEVGDVLVVADEFVIASAPNDRQVKAIVDEVEQVVAEAGHRGRSGSRASTTGTGSLMDYGDVVVHVFLEETRQYYELERLWADVPRVEWAPPLRGSGLGAERIGGVGTEPYGTCTASRAP